MPRVPCRPEPAFPDWPSSAHNPTSAPFPSRPTFPLPRPSLVSRSGSHGPPCRPILVRHGRPCSTPILDRSASRPFGKCADHLLGSSRRVGRGGGGGGGGSTTGELNHSVAAMVCYSSFLISRCALEYMGVDGRKERRGAGLAENTGATGRRVRLDLSCISPLLSACQGHATQHGEGSVSQSSVFFAKPMPGKSLSCSPTPSDAVVQVLMRPVADVRARP